MKERDRKIGERVREMERERGRVSLEIQRGERGNTERSEGESLEI